MRGREEGRAVLEMQNSHCLTRDYLDGKAGLGSFIAVATFPPPPQLLSLISILAPLLFIQVILPKEDEQSFLKRKLYIGLPWWSSG